MNAENIREVIGILVSMSERETKDLLADLEKQHQYLKNRLAEQANHVDEMIHHSTQCLVNAYGAAILKNKTPETTVTQSAIAVLKESAGKNELLRKSEKDDRKKEIHQAKKVFAEKAAQSLSRQAQRFQDFQREEELHKKSKGTTFIDKNEENLQRTVTNIQAEKESLLRHLQLLRSAQAAVDAWHYLFRGNYKKRNQFFEQPYSDVHRALINFLDKRGEASDHGTTSGS